jgi:hypothetical protein
VVACRAASASRSHASATLARTARPPALQVVQGEDLRVREIEIA